MGEKKPDRRRIPDTTPWTKPPYFGRTIALWGLYSAFMLGRSTWHGPASVGNIPSCYRRRRCGAIVLTKHTVAPGTAAKRLSPRGFRTRNAALSRVAAKIPAQPFPPRLALSEWRVKRPETA